MMKILAVTCNIVLFGSTGLILLTDGTSREPGYLVLTLLLLLTPIISSLVIFRSGVSAGRLAFRRRKKAPVHQTKTRGRSAGQAAIKIGAIIGNIVLLGFVGWALVSTYPHPEEPGFVEFALLAVLTPVFSLVAISRPAARTTSPPSV